MTLLSMPPLLSMNRIGKRFGGTEALREVSLDVAPGEIVALLGENGAGKSTLIKILAGVHKPDAGSITFDGAEGSHDAGSLPISFIHQDLGLIPWMTVTENIAFTLGFVRRFGLVDWAATARRAAAALAALDLAIHPETRVRNLGRAEQALVAIARAIAAENRLLVLDEPTASLTAADVEKLFSRLARLKARGVGMVYVTHRLDEVFAIADRVVVLRDGRLAGEGPVLAMTPEALITLIVGNIVAAGERDDAPRGAVRLALAGLTVAGAGPCDCAFRAGEIVGLVGLSGAGQERVARALFGLLPAEAGGMMVEGAPFRPRDPNDAMARGVGFISGDRMGLSTAPRLTVAENMFLNPLAHGIKPFARYGAAREADAARAIGAKIGLRPNQPELPLEALSGGNQQKVVIGRWLDRPIRIFVFEDPTSGVDVGARADIYQLFRQAVRDGALILIVSSDFEEVAKICDRALVFDRGRIVAELAGADLTIPGLLGAASAGLRTSDVYQEAVHGIG